MGGEAFTCPAPAEGMERGEKLSCATVIVTGPYESVLSLMAWHMKCRRVWSADGSERSAEEMGDGESFNASPLPFLRPRSLWVSFSVPARWFRR